jgi:hypothetical protein
VLAASTLAAASLGTAGCATLDAASAASRVSPDVTLLRAAIAAKTAMIARYRATAAAHPALRSGLAPLLGDHQAHLDELQHRLVQPPHPSAPASPSPRTGAQPPPQVPAGDGAAVSALISAEQAAAATHITQLRSATPSFAQLLASIAACEATHASALAAL